MSNPYLIQGPALISFSGGRTSGYMLHQIIQAHGGTLPPDVRVTFANTGKEMPETLAFVKECGEQFGVEIVWLEYRRVDDKHSFAVVDYASASRNGEPFKALIDSRNFLPNPVTRFCTVELKIRTMARYGLSLGLEEFDKVIGLRADEPRRVSKMRNRSKESGERGERGERDVLMPLATAGVTKADVSAFWASRNFDLRLPNVNGTTAYGNCDLCFLKGAGTISGIMREMPSLADWWIKAEAEARSSSLSGARFRYDRPSYAEMLKAVQNQRGFDFSSADELNDCYCTGDA